MDLNVTLAEMKSLKQEAEIQIAQIIANFINDTSLAVKSISVNSGQQDAGASPLLINVSVNLEVSL